MPGKVTELSGAALGRTDRFQNTRIYLTFRPADIVYKPQLDPANYQQFLATRLLRS
jgi:hypothetical protein